MLLAPHLPPDPLSLSPSLEEPPPPEELSNPWDSFFNMSHHSSEPFDLPDPGPSCPDLDQQLSQKLLREERASTAPSVYPFPHAPDPDISPAAMFLAALIPPPQPARQPDDESETVAGYVLGPVIGRGGFSTVRQAFSPSGGVVAIKIVRRSDIARQSDPSSARKRLDHEAEIWSSLSHEHVLPLFSAEHTSFADFYVTLFCPAGSLFDILKRDGSPALPLDDAGMMFRQVVRGVRYLHEVAGYVHRDIKLENVLVDEMGVCRLCDFGLARKIGESDDDGEHVDDHDDPPLHRHRSAIHHTVRHAKPTLPSHASILRHGPRRHRTSTPIGDNAPAPVHPAHAFHPGSLPYAAPELLSPQTSGRHYGANPAQDMWALGCLLYALLTGRLPFYDPFEPRLTMKILHGVYDMPCEIGRGAGRVLKGCLERDVRDRWTIVMVDEMAWDIGWGQVDESSSVSHADEFEFVDCPDRPTRRHSRSRSCDHDPPSARLRRSLSCSSASTSSSLSSRSTSRSVSRPPPPTVTRLPLMAACDDVARASTTVSSPISLDIGDSALASPTFLPVERGRSPIKADRRLPSRFAPSEHASTSRSGLLGREPSHGRETYPPTDVSIDTARWASALGLKTIAEVTTHLGGVTSPAMTELRKIQHQDACRCGESHNKITVKRAGSTPPVSSAWSFRHRRAREESPSSSRVGVGGFLCEPGATPIAIAVCKNGSRSRSVGHERDGAARGHF